MSGAQPFSWGMTAFSAGVINTLINAPIGWFMVKEGARLGVWTLPGVAPDLVVTAGGIAFGTALVCTPLTRKQVASAKLIPPVVPAGLRAWFEKWPRSALLRAINLSILCGALFAPLPLLALWLTGLPDADRLTVTLIKGGFSFVEGALVTPIIVAAATVDPIG